LWNMFYALVLRLTDGRKEQVWNIILLARVLLIFCR